MKQKLEELFATQLREQEKLLIVRDYQGALAITSSASVTPILRTKFPHDFLFGKIVDQSQADDSSSLSRANPLRSSKRSSTFGGIADKFRESSRSSIPPMYFSNEGGPGSDVVQDKQSRRHSSQDSQDQVKDVTQPQNAKGVKEAEKVEENIPTEKTLIGGDTIGMEKELVTSINDEIKHIENSGTSFNSSNKEEHIEVAEINIATSDHITESDESKAIAEVDVLSAETIASASSQEVIELDDKAKEAELVVEVADLSDDIQIENENTDDLSQNKLKTSENMDDLPQNKLKTSENIDDLSQNKLKTSETSLDRIENIQEESTEISISVDNVEKESDLKSDNDEDEDELGLTYDDNDITMESEKASDQEILEEMKEKLDLLMPAIHNSSDLSRTSPDKILEEEHHIQGLGVHPFKPLLDEINQDSLGSGVARGDSVLVHPVSISETFKPNEEKFSEGDNLTFSRAPKEEISLKEIESTTLMHLSNSKTLENDSWEEVDTSKDSSFESPHIPICELSKVIPEETEKLHQEVSSEVESSPVDSKDSAIDVAWPGSSLTLSALSDPSSDDRQRINELNNQLLVHEPGVLLETKFQATNEEVEVHDNIPGACITEIDPPSLLNKCTLDILTSKVELSGKDSEEFDAACDEFSGAHNISLASEDDVCKDSFGFSDQKNDFPSHPEGKSEA